MYGNPNNSQTLIHIRNSTQSIVSNSSFRNGQFTMYGANNTTYINSCIFVDSLIYTFNPVTSPFVVLNDCNISAVTLTSSLISLAASATSATYGISTNNCTWVLGAAKTITHTAGTSLATIIIDSRGNKGDYVTLAVIGSADVANIIVEQPLKAVLRSGLPTTYIPLNSVAHTSDFGMCRFDSTGVWTQQLTSINALALPISASPLSSGTGTVGSIRWDGGFIYICVAANSWRRVALSAY